MVDITGEKSSQFEPEIKHYLQLLKPRVMRLVIFTAAVGLFAAPVSVHPIIILASLLCVAMGAGAAASLNMWWDADIDLIMTRTRRRPIPAGRISSEQAVALGLSLSVFSVMMLGLFANLVAAALLAFTIFFYVVVYSMWLKRFTAQNIVIGGAAGALPPMIGWSIAAGNITVESVLMFLIIFAWTPPHFWTLALFVNSDYAKAKVPMLTVVKGKRSTRKHIFFYTIVLTLISLLLAFTKIGGMAYFIVAVALNGYFLIGTLQLVMKDEKHSRADNYRRERQIFLFSIFYLFALFAGIVLEVVLSNFHMQPKFWPTFL